MKQRRPSASWAAIGRMQSKNGDLFPLVLRRLYLECCVHFRASQYKRNLDILERVYWRTTKTIKGLEHLSYEKRLGLLSLKKR